jgi:hypothetical protein
MSERRRPLTLRQMRQRVDAAVAELNAAEAGRAGRVLVAWGEASKEAEARRRRAPAKDRWASALLTFDGPDSWYVDAEVFRGYAAPGSSACLTLRAAFAGGYRLPRDNPRRLFNLLEALLDGVRLDITPEPAEGTTGGKPRMKEDLEIVVWGVLTAMPVEGLTGPLLDDALFRLLDSANAVGRILGGEEEAEDDAWGRLYEEE